MSLDLTRVASQVESMVSRLKAGVSERHQRLERALGVLGDEANDIERLRHKVSHSKTTWLVAGLAESLGQHYPPPPCPPEFTVIAVDGSHIEVDRHRSARCYLINLGSVILRYGADPAAVLDSLPRLYSEDKDLLIVPGMAGGREQPVEGALLGIKRGVEECRRLAELAGGLASDGPALALLDGSLVLWGLEAYPEFVTEALLSKGFLSYLDDIRRLNNSGKRRALASYISFPRSTDVVNVLRLVLCPHELADCDRYCPGGEKRECDAVSGVRDSELFYQTLGQGERSALFISRSSVVEKHYGRHQVYFFYLNTGDEIARVEMPQWAALDGGLLDLAHALALDQCRRGNGYPVALSEAHEQAVVATADREQFWQLVEASLADERLPFLTSAKSLSKRTRWI
ncbi:MAG: DNA double-strand break repair nuclease NurA [Chloroflexi bacterium]|nr:DNA double-strand break repair nuclease NurA [Chloroflexota bacterium]